MCSKESASVPTAAPAAGRIRGMEVALSTSAMEARPMTRRLLVLIAPLLLGAALLARFADVTFVMKNGERISGTFSYNHTDHYQLIISGRERSYPSDDIAMIAFTPGDPSAREIG